MIEGERYDWLIDNVKHPDVIEMITLMRVRSELERAKMLRVAASRSGVARCALADYLEGERPEPVAAVAPLSGDAGADDN